jgi:uncharacterized protein YqgV (UPF0045/DUF77 family)
MPGYNRAELTAELEIVPSPRAQQTPHQQVEAARNAAGATGLARDAGPDTTLLAGGRAEVLAAVTKVIEAALDAGAREVRLKVEAEEDADRFGGPGGRRNPG